ncbi:MAG: hypothetical protein B6240_14920 [Desulfobacteraceae bacterium 4572_87]|nr:MAG: hypothetical protein B6240_14920 [Desulfobacteraceae bacterium 4572_87]
MITVFSFVFPFLLMMALCQRVMMSWGKHPTGWMPTMILASASSAMVILPIGGLPVGRWLVSLYPNPSIPLTALLLSWVLKNAFQFNLLDMRAIQTCRVFSLLAGVILYPMALGAGSFDPYCAGWHFSWLFVILLCVTLSLLFFRNRFSVLLLATILAYDLHLLESSNLWDYLVDPILVIVAIVGLIVRMVRA